MSLGATYSEASYKQYEIGDENIFEDIIDKMILDEVAGMNESFRRAISSLPKKDKRMAILSLLDKDRNLFTKIKDSISNESLSKLDHVKDTVLMLREYVKIAEVEKKKFGEVMTPLDLVKEMLATLPVEVWSNPNLKWLDPANGTGPFPIIVIYKLMKGLENWEPNEELRYKHIIENMIYVCELQPKNMFLYLCTIDPKDEYDCNIYTGSFLEEEFDKHMKEVWNVDKFDIIIGNPPYNDDSNNKGNTLWDKFVLKSINSIIKYLVLVHPSGWRNIEGKFEIVKNTLLSKDILYLNMNSYEDGLKTFNAGTSFDFYCVRNTNTDIKTKIIDIDNNEYDMNLKSVKFIPNCNIDEIYSLISNEKEDKVNISYSFIYEPRKKYMNNEQSLEFRYPCIYSIKKGGIPTFKWSSIDRGHFGVSKIICGNGANPTFMKDYNGEYGMTQWTFGIIDDIDNLEKISEFLNSEKVNTITRATKFVSTAGNPIIYPKIISLFRKDFWKEFI